MITPYVNIIFLAIMKHHNQASYKENDLFIQKCKHLSMVVHFLDGAPQHVMP